MRSSYRPDVHRGKLSFYELGFMQQSQLDVVAVITSHTHILFMMSGNRSHCVLKDERREETEKEAYNFKSKLRGRVNLKR